MRRRNRYGGLARHRHEATTLRTCTMGWNISDARLLGFSRAKGNPAAVDRRIRITERDHRTVGCPGVAPGADIVDRAGLEPGNSELAGPAAAIQSFAAVGLPGRGSPFRAALTECRR
jgi:hypothetical protein